MGTMSMDKKFPYCNPELWGGIECTINRVNDTYKDQCKATGHYDRDDDISAFAALGIKKLRYPVLWERHVQDMKDEIDWSYSEIQLNKIRTEGVEPIVGLIHHGSGPTFTNLLDKKFPEHLAEYAEKVAKKFPWVEYYTPVNEPLTTARFSGLYGFWYPHKKTGRAFARMLINQLKAIVLSMQAIRTVNPNAKLVQTEDLAKTHSSSTLRYQANFENKRRWLTYDLLCGKVNKKHFFWNYFQSLGIQESELKFFLDNPCVPDIMGFNYYVTSERYLDEKLDGRNRSNSGNGRHRYHDTEAVRAGRWHGMKALLCEAWSRYKLPMAVTECHLSCSREEQLRWFREAWDTCCELRRENVDIRAITAWSLLGAHDWNSLLTAANDHYESGVFHVYEQERRPTALAKMLTSLSGTGDFSHPVLSSKGWWLRKKTDLTEAAPILITGASGTLGHAFVEVCKQRAIPFITVTRNELDIASEKMLYNIIDKYEPWAIINAAGYVRVDDAEHDRGACFEANAEGPFNLARACKQKGIRLMTFSSDLVFDGEKGSPYDEYDKVNPLNIYGESKAVAEEKVLSINKDALVIRTSAFFGPWDKYNFVYNVMDSLKQERQFFVTDEIQISPTYVPDLVNTALDLLIDEEAGVWHISNNAVLSWADFGLMVAERSGLKKDKLVCRRISDMGWEARRPLYSVLKSARGIRLPTVENALDRYFEQRINF
jgi:dTDP-4-dehydrorhamnose reductase